MKIPKVNDFRYYAFCEEICNQTHTLIAGATGSGKSVVINNIIAGYILHNKLPITAADRTKGCGIVLIDPKKVELSCYKSVPHCMGHYTTPKAITRAFSSLERVMDRRYRSMRLKGQRKWIGQDIYVFIDEFIEIAEIKPVQASIKRLATLGRAANIHLIIATQRPSISDRLMPAVLRANMDCTVCLRTKEAKDSRMICGHDGAEQFPRPASVGYAECFFCTPGQEKHISFGMMTDKEIYRIINGWHSAFSFLYKSRLF